MTENEIIKEFLSLLSKYWDDPKAHQGYRLLREKVSGQGKWPGIIDARLMALEKRTEESIALLKETLVHNPHNVFASLLLGSIQCDDNNQPEEAIRIYNSLLDSDFKDQPNQEWLQALTLYTKGVALGDMNNPEDENQAYDEVVNRFGESSDLSLQEQVARALYNKGCTLGDMDKPDEEIQTYDELIRLFGESNYLPLQERWPMHCTTRVLR